MTAAAVVAATTTTASSSATRRGRAALPTPRAPPTSPPSATRTPSPPRRPPPAPTPRPGGRPANTRAGGGGDTRWRRAAVSVRCTVHFHCHDHRFSDAPTPPTPLNYPRPAHSVIQHQLLDVIRSILCLIV